MLLEKWNAYAKTQKYSFNSVSISNNSNAKVIDNSLENEFYPRHSAKLQNILRKIVLSTLH